MEESIDVEIRYSPNAAGPPLLPDELALLESMLPELIHAIMALEATEAEQT